MGTELGIGGSTLLVCRHRCRGRDGVAPGVAVWVSVLGSLWGGELAAQVRDGIEIGNVPLLEIGVAEGENPYLFSGISGAFLLDDGRVVVCDGELVELRVY